jgi:phytoene dehydrogenase-like protein
MTNSPVTDVLVVGAGLAGLSAAIELKAAGRDVLVLEASDGPGGRVRTDQVDGYLLDRGFQILLTAYPEAQRMLNYGLLDLRSFHPGALIRTDAGGSTPGADGFARLGDPFRRPADLVSTVRAPVGTLADKARILQFRQAVNRGSIDELWQRPETTARQRLDSAGFSAAMIDGFLQPLFAGITLDAELSGSSRSLEFVFRMLSGGQAAVPADGMGEIPAQLAARLADGQIRYNSPVQKATADSVHLADGESLSARSVIVATDASSAASLTALDDRAWNGVTSVWFSADRAPIDDPIIALNGTGSGPINNLAVMSNVSDRYAPAGKHLIVVSTPTVGGGQELVVDIEAQLATWFADAASWERLRVDEIPHAQPAHPPGTDRRASARLADGVVVAGDHRTDPSINGAMLSGVRAARSVTAGH